MNDLEFTVTGALTTLKRAVDMCFNWRLPPFRVAIIFHDDRTAREFESTLRCQPSIGRYVEVGPGQFPKICGVPIQITSDERLAAPAQRRLVNVLDQPGPPITSADAYKQE